MSLALTHLNRLRAEFAEADLPNVIAALDDLTPAHAMDSQSNLDNAIDAILNLSQGDAEELIRLVEAARTDFRDVIYWWSLEQQKAAQVITVVHEGRGGYVELDGARYPIDHVAEGCFCIHFPAGNRHANLQAHLEALNAFAEARSPKWYIENRSRKYTLPEA